ncbi:MAG: WYL domain-containing protein [Campylobacter sp.]|nr:WYL domain-containing protein [Campylobacter sp.]
MDKIKNESENSKYERVNLLYNMLKDRAYGIKELAEILSVSTKTVQRDLHEVLSKYGAVRNGRMWRIDESKIDDNLNQDERIVINILDNVSKNMGANFYQKAHVLLTKISQQLNHPILININNEKLGANDLRNFQILEDAIKEKIQIECEYNGYKFRVKPIKLALFDGFWYLLLLDSKKNDTFKKFHLKSIKEIKILDDKFEVPNTLEERIRNANSVWFNLNKPQIARLLLAPQITKYFERKPYAKQSITGKDNDGSVEIEIEYTNMMEIKPLIYYYIPFIKVLEPKELADTIRDEIKEYFGEIGE